MNFKDFFQSKSFTIITWVVAALAVILLVFQAGIAVGSKKADFSCKWGENYRQNFGGPGEGQLPMPGKDDLMGAHGAVGEIIKIDNFVLTIKGQDNMEKSVLVESNTSIVNARKNITLADIKSGDNVVVIGDPDNSGQIDAKFIRVLPAPSSLDLLNNKK
jgi:hypothetical protein